MTIKTTQAENDFYETCLDIASALSKKGDAWRLGSLATTANGDAEVRNVVLRNIDTHQGLIEIYTDIRSNKVTELSLHPMCSLLLWCPTRQQQLRLKGRAIVKQAAPDKWLMIKEKLTLQDYSGSIAPGKTIDDSNWFLETALAEKNFAIIEFYIEQIDRLWILREGHRRARIRRDDIFWIAP